MVAKMPIAPSEKGFAAKADGDIANLRGTVLSTSSEDTQRFERHLQVARRIMRENRGVLRELAK